jgi:hypothetical protein
MGADSAVSKGAEVAIGALYLNIVWISPADYVAQYGHGVPTAALVNLLPMLPSPAAYVADS